MEQPNRDKIRKRNYENLYRLYEDIDNWEAQNQKPSMPRRIGHGVLKVLAKFAQTYGGDGNFPPTTYF